MILKNKTKYLLMAGMPGILTTPLYAQQIYMCKQCDPGTYAKSGATICSPCGAGTFTPYAGSTSCERCSAGTYSGVGARSCTQCSAGTYSNAGASSCTPCASGYYQSNTGKSNCDPCPAGYRCDRTSKYICSAGTFSRNYEANCTQCSPGQYQDAAGQSGCKSCNAGQYQPYAGQSSCYTCSANTYSSAGAASCTPCTGWSYSSAGASSCTALKFEIESTIAELTTGGLEMSGTLYPGFYVIILGGGNGGALNHGYHAAYSITTNEVSIGYGAQLQYVIKVDNNTSYTIGSGADGQGSDETCAATGGGGGSWANIGGTYYIAGGGGGAVTGICGSVVTSQAGYGGGVGGGGGGGDNYGSATGRNGGASGNYKGGAGRGGDNPGDTGAGISPGIGGGVDSTNGCKTDRYTKPNNPYGGIGGLFSTGKCFDDQVKRDYSYNEGSYTYGGSFWVRDGGNGKTSHTANTDKFTSRLCRNCAKIFKLR